MQFSDWCMHEIDGNSIENALQNELTLESQPKLGSKNKKL